MAKSKTIACVCAQPLSCVLLFCDLRDCSPSVSSVHRISPARILDCGRQAPVTGGDGGPGPAGGAGSRWRRAVSPRESPTHAGEEARQKEDPKNACGGRGGVEGGFS